MEEYAVVVGAGSLQCEDDQVVRFPHRWTPGGVTVQADFTGAHLLHLANAGCVLDDLYREAEDLGLRLDGVRVTASGGYDAQTWVSAGITYQVELDSAEETDDLVRLVLRVDEVDEIPRAVRAGAPVRRR